MTIVNINCFCWVTAGRRLVLIIQSHALNHLKLPAFHFRQWQPILRRLDFNASFSTLPPLPSSLGYRLPLGGHWNQIQMQRVRTINHPNSLFNSRLYSASTFITACPIASTSTTCTFTFRFSSCPKVKTNHPTTKPICSQQKRRCFTDSTRTKHTSAWFYCTIGKYGRTAAIGFHWRVESVYLCHCLNEFACCSMCHWCLLHHWHSIGTQILNDSTENLNQHFFSLILLSLLVAVVIHQNCDKQ